MIFNSMDTPETREEFEARCFHLLNAIRSGQYKGILGDRHREEIVFLPNGRVDLANIDTMTRLSMNSLYDFHYNKENYPHFDLTDQNEHEVNAHLLSPDISDGPDT